MTEHVHLKLSASGAYRWMKCPGSVRLSDGLVDEPSEYSREGTHAHAVAAACLTRNCDTWEVVGEEFEGIVCSAETADAVQVYLDYVRSLPGEPGTMHVVDYKHGIGIQVEVEENPQLLDYAYMALLKGESGVEVRMDCSEVHPDLFGTADYILPPPDGTYNLIRMHIVQPRGFHSDGPCRQWVASADFIMAWAQEKLLPAMHRVDEPGADGVFAAGEHCRFCPAKLMCPELCMIYEDVAKATAPEGMSDETLVRYLNWMVPVKAFVKALEKEGYQRKSNKRTLPGWKLVRKSGARVWKDGAVSVIEKVLGILAYETPKLVSPAKAEKLPGGKVLAAKWAYKPSEDAGLTLVPESDRREAVVPESATEAFSELISSD